MTFSSKHPSMLALAPCTMLILSINPLVLPSSGSLHLWHHHMGHLNIDAIYELSKKNLVKGLDIVSFHEYDHVCEGCVLSKSHRQPISKLSTTIYELMELIVVDLTGPMNLPTWGGLEFVLVVVEVSKQFGVGRLLTTKKEAAQALKEIVVMLEMQSGKKLRKI